MSKKFTIHIPDPCHEDWQQMLPDEQGRFCLACQKSVIDFTDKSTEEIEQIIGRSKGKVCGRFLESQLDNEVAVREKKQPSVWWKVYALAISAMFTAQLAKPSPAKAQTEQTQDAQQKSPQQSTKIPPVVISGRVVADTLPVAGAKLTVKQLVTHSDKEGKFKLEIPSEVLAAAEYLKIEVETINPHRTVVQLDRALPVQFECRAPHLDTRMGGVVATPVLITTEKERHPAARWIYELLL